jgi:hypothetical protein
MLQNLLMVRGNTFRFAENIAVDTVPVNLTGATIRMTAKWAVTDSDPNAVFQISNATSAITIVGAAADGNIQVSVPAASTLSLPLRKVELPYDIQLIESSGNVSTVRYGTLTILPNVTLTG